MLLRRRKRYLNDQLQKQELAALDDGVKALEVLIDLERSAAAARVGAQEKLQRATPSKFMGALETNRQAMMEKRSLLIKSFTGTDGRIPHEKPLFKGRIVFANTTASTARDVDWFNWTTPIGWPVQVSPFIFCVSLAYLFMSVHRFMARLSAGPVASSPAYTGYPWW